MEEKEKALVKNWLSEFKGLPEVAVAAYAERVQEKASVVPALYSAMHDMGTELLEPICHQLFEFIRSGEAALHRFALQFVPELIWRHLSAVARRDKPSQGSVEALLLGIYNLETVDDEGKPKVLSFTVPSLSKSSIYHEPCSIGSLALTEEGLSQRGAGKAVYADSYPQRESITAQNRFEVLTSLLLYYNSAIVFMPLSSYHSLCQLCTRACVSGFPRQRMKRDWKEPHPRVPLLAEFLVQLLEGVYHAIYNGAWDMGKRAVEDALYRSKLELYPEPLLLARAIKSSLLQDAPHAGRGRSRCLQLEVTPTSSRISRSVVTSASIRSHRWKKEGEGSEWDQQLDREEDNSLLEGMGDFLSNGNSSKSPNWQDSDETLVRQERGDKQAIEVDSLPLGTAPRPTNGGSESAVDTSLPTVIFETEFGAHDYSPGLVVPGESRAHLGATPGSPSHSRSCEVVYRSGGRNAGQDSAIDRHSTLSLQDDARRGAEGKTGRLLPEDALKRLQRTPSFKVQLISAL